MRKEVLLDGPEPSASPDEPFANASTATPAQAGVTI
jgi:hypothetical protein